MRQYGNEIQLYPGSDGKVREVILAEHAGFCFGVQRAVDAVYDEIGRSGDIYTYGPVIHNDIVVRDLEKRGVRIISSEDEIDAVNSGTVIIRSHGVSRAIFEKLSNKPGIKLIDMTCRQPEPVGKADRHHRKCRPCGSRRPYGMVRFAGGRDRDKGRGRGI